MAWQTPKTDWVSNDVVTKDDMNRIEKNIQELQDTKETPTGAQAKVDAAFTAATAYTDEVADELESHKNDKVAHIDYAVASGTNTYTANIQGITALVEGLSVKIKFQNANTGAATLNINGLGTKQIRKSNGNALSAGNIKAGQICHLVYTGSVFQLLGEGGEYGTAQPEHVLEGYTIGTDEGVVEGTMPNRGAMVIIPGPSYKWIPEGYHNGSGYVRGDNDLKSENIKAGVNIFGVDGTLIPLQSASGSEDIISTYTTISGLPFRPKFITVRYSYWTGDTNNIFDSIFINTSSYSYTIRTRGTSTPSVVDESPFTLYDDGFRFRLPSSYADTIIENNCKATWNAWG